MNTRTDRMDATFTVVTGLWQFTLKACRTILHIAMTPIQVPAWVIAGAIWMFLHYKATLMFLIHALMRLVEYNIVTDGFKQLLGNWFGA